MRREGNIYNSHIFKNPCEQIKGSGTKVEIFYD